ncbi:MAG: terpene synthase family protein [Nannocystaceae bacterium]|nr:terpene synthase family protein [bacterium]
MSTESSSTDDRIRSLVAQTRAWLVDAGLLPGLSEAAVDAKAEVICTFATLCAPTPASARGQRLAAQLTGVFFFLDDAEPDVLRSTIDEMVPVLRDQPPPSAPSGPADAFFAYLAEVSALGPVHWFKAQFLAFLEALLEEAEQLADGPLSMQGYLALRHRVIFVEEYIWTWLLSEGRPMDEAGVRGTALLRRLASEVVYLVNDLGSVERERAAGALDPNLVFLLEREEGCSEAAAVAQVVRRHDDAVARYTAERERLLQDQPLASVSAMVGVLDDTLAGNLETTLRLVASRYPGAAEALGQLRAYPDRLRGHAPT